MRAIYTHVWWTNLSGLLFFIKRTRDFEEDSLGALGYLFSHPSHLVGGSLGGSSHGLHSTPLWAVICVEMLPAIFALPIELHRSMLEPCNPSDFFFTCEMFKVLVHALHCRFWIRAQHPFTIGKLSLWLSNWMHKGDRLYLILYAQFVTKCNSTMVSNMAAIIEICNHYRVLCCYGRNLS